MKQSELNAPSFCTRRAHVPARIVACRTHTALLCILYVSVGKTFSPLTTPLSLSSAATTTTVAAVVVLSPQRFWQCSDISISRGELFACFFSIPNFRGTNEVGRVACRLSQRRSLKGRAGVEIPLRKRKDPQQCMQQDHPTLSFSCHTHHVLPHSVQHLISPREMTFRFCFRE